MVRRSEELGFVREEAVHEAEALMEEKMEAALEQMHQQDMELVEVGARGG